MHDNLSTLGTGAETVQTQTIRHEPDSVGPWSFVLNYPRPPKGLHANDRTHWSVKAGATADIRLEVFAKTRALHIGVLEKIRVEVVWVVGDKRKRDTDGPAPMLKAIYDGIASDRGVSARVVEDDSPEFVDKPGLTFAYVKGIRPHFRVSIIDLSADHGGDA